MIKSIKLTNFLSFGAESKEIELCPLNSIIGTNGCGKSNFIEAFDLLQNLPSNIGIPIREGGGFSDWLYKGSNNGQAASLDVVINNSFPNKKCDELRYAISFNAIGQGYEITEECLVSKGTRPGEIKPYIYYEFKDGRPMVNIQNPDSTSNPQYRTLQREDIDMTQSILSQKRDAIHYPELTYLAQEFSKIRMYREWQFGRYTPPRMRQKADMLNQYLEPDCTNLGLVLNQIDMNPASKKHLSLVCIEEPELGLHPDILPNLGKLILEVSERCQLIITTHSEIFVDSFSENQEAIMVAEKNQDGTVLTRLNKERLRPWLEKYRLDSMMAPEGGIIIEIRRRRYTT